MSDEQPPEVGSRRRRREIREARERARAAQRERESAVRRLSTSSTAGPGAADSGAADSEAPEPRPALFDQETQTPKDERSHRPHSAQSARPQPTGADSAEKTRSAAGAEGYLTRREIRRLRTQQTPVQQPPADPKPADTAEPGGGTESATPAQQSGPASEAASAAEPVAQPEVAPVSHSPSTLFEQVVAPHSAPSPEVQEEGIAPDEADALDAEWVAAAEGYIAEDEDGAPVLVEASDYGRGYQTVAPAEGHMNLSMLKRRQAKRRRRNITLTIALAGFAVLVISFVLILRSFLGGGAVDDYETQAGETIEFQVVEGDGFESVANRLVEEEIIASGDAFWDSLGELENEPTPQAGTYEVREQMPAEDAVAALFEDSPAGRYYALNPGVTVDEALAAIADGTHVTLQELEELNANPQQFGLPEEAESLEGYLAPGEYRPGLEATAEEIIEAAVAPTFEQLEELNVTDEQQQWRTVIIGSLITAEANHEQPDDYAVIAGAIENRLQPDNTETDGLLQIDAAVNYGLEGETGLHFSDEDRQDVSNPYNTNQNEGLPPGPIAAPTTETLEAAANPADTDNYYWVTVNIATGETEFNETYAEHQEDVDEFLRWCREEDEDDLCGPAEVEAAEDVVQE